MCMPVTQVVETSAGILIGPADLVLVKFGVWGEPISAVNSLGSWPNGVRNHDFVLLIAPIA